MPRPIGPRHFLDYAAYIFDLDGVITRTALVHAAAWKEMFDEFLRRWSIRTGKEQAPFDEEADYRQYVDGKPRYQGVESFLTSRGITLPAGDPGEAPGWDTVAGLGNSKNLVFQLRVAHEGVAVHEAAVRLVRELRQLGKPAAIVTSSKNGPMIIHGAGLDGLFDPVIDGNVAAELHLTGKPSPDIFLEAARRLSVPPAQAVVFEDAVAGVEAGVAGGFGCVIGVDRGGNRERLAQAGATLVVSDLSCLGRGLPEAVAGMDQMLKEAVDREVVVFLDYDGTLTPIVERPELAVLSGSRREALARLARLATVAVISGRDLADVRQLVGLDNLCYAGSHGLDIAGPEGLKMQSGQGVEFLPLLDEVEQVLRQRLQDVRGLLLERKRFSIAVHYRLVDETDLPEVEQLVDEILARHPNLRDSPGKKVHDLRPDIDWDKGKAIAWLLEALGKAKEAVYPLYLGDDLTDEDAFRLLRGWGAGIWVRDGEERLTLASLTLAGTAQVQEFLGALADRLAGEGRR